MQALPHAGFLKKPVRLHRSGKKSPRKPAPIKISINPSPSPRLSHAINFKAMWLIYLLRAFFFMTIIVTYFM